MSIEFKVKLTPDEDGTLLVTCPALPEVTTFGVNESEALHHASEAIEEALAARMADGEDLDQALAKGRVVDAARAFTVRLPTQTELKIELYRALRRSGMSRADLMRRLGWKRESVDRLFRLDHNSRLDQLEAAFRALGRTLDVEVRDVA